MADPDVRREVAAALAKQQRERLPNGESADETENNFTDAIEWTTELVIPWKRHKRAGRGWSGDTQTKVELEMADTKMHTAWHNLKAATKDAQLRKAVRRASKKVKRTRIATVTSYFERYIQEMEEQLRRHDQIGFVQHTKSMVEPKCIHDEDG